VGVWLSVAANDIQPDHNAPCTREGPTRFYPAWLSHAKRRAFTKRGAMKKLRSKHPTVYLLHFVKPYKHARHYLGYSTNLDKRITDHLAGMGARLLEVVTDAGIEWKLARTWRGDRELERRLKNRKEAPKLCPICNPKALNRAKENAR
jgi:predicted GIY-YIG superfamily endonuclease